uniref:CSON004572 protein n=1 Tax=Culicoides sonorensis TaxID=179676 RepID=A0A336MRI4_CULSO
MLQIFVYLLTITSSPSSIARGRFAMARNRIKHLVSSSSSSNNQINCRTTGSNNMRIKRESPCLGLRFMPIKLGVKIEDCLLDTGQAFYFKK